MSLRWRITMIGLVVALFGFLTVNNFVPEERRAESPLLPDEGMRLGLDLQGGIHWVLGVQLDIAVEHELEFLQGSLEDQVEDDGITLQRLDVEAGRLVVEPFGVPDAAAVREWAQDTRTLRSVADSDERLEFALTDDWEQEVRSRGMQQVLEVLRRRIADPIRGIPDSVVTRQGSDRVLVQIPGGQIERTRARELLRVTGFLEFKIVRDSAQSEELLRAKYDVLPEGTEMVFERDRETQRELFAYLVNETADLTGDYLKDARVGFDRQQRPVVNFTFNAQGGKIFGELTGANIGKQLAIVLDELVYSAPEIKSASSLLLAMRRALQLGNKIRTRRLEGRHHAEQNTRRDGNQ